MIYIYLYLIYILYINEYYEKCLISNCEKDYMKSIDSKACCKINDNKCNVNECVNNYVKKLMHHLIILIVNQVVKMIIHYLMIILLVVKIYYM